MKSNIFKWYGKQRGNHVFITPRLEDLYETLDKKYSSII